MNGEHLVKGTRFKRFLRSLKPHRGGGFRKFLLMAGLLSVGTSVLWFRHNANPHQIIRPFPIDLMFYHYPMMVQAAERLSEGCVPLWNPYQCCGVPFLATTQVGVFYPGNWISLLLPVASGLKILMFGEIFLAGLFTSLFYRSLDRSHYSAAVGGVLFVFACILGQTRWPCQVSTILWIPFLFLCTETFVRGGNWKWWAGFTLGTTLQLLAGFPQFLVYGFYLLAPYAVMRLISLLGSGRLTRVAAARRAASLVAGGVLATGIASVQLLPSMELVNNSVRAGRLDQEETDYLEKRTEWKSLTLPRVLSNAFNPKPKWVAFDLSYGTGYMGMATLFLIALGMVGHRRDPVMWFFLLAAVISMTLSFGAQEWSRGLYKLYSSLPTGSLFRTPSRFRLLSLFSSISLAVFGLDQFRAGFPELRNGIGWRILTGVGLLGLFGVTVWLSHGLGILLALAGGGVLGAAWLLHRKSRALLVLQGLLAVLIVFDLGHATGAHGVMRDLPVQWGQCFHFRAGKVVDAEAFANVVQDAGYDRVFVYNMRPIKTLPKLGRVYAVSDFEPMIPARWADASEAMKGTRIRPMYAVDYVKYGRFYDLASVKHFIVASRDKTKSRQGSNNYQPSFRRWSPGPALPGIRARLIPNPDALPRAYLVGKYEVVEVREALSRLVKGNFDVNTTVLLEKDPGLAQLPPRTALRAAKIVSYEPERVVVYTNCSEARMLILTDTWYPGWKAFIDGTETEIYRANYLFRAVRMPAGAHEVVFEYRPASFQAGVKLSVVSLAMFALLCVICAFLSRPQRDAPTS